jgi:hypothetical protein
MDEKISLKALEDYSDDYASKVTASFFAEKEKITGPEILKVCDIHQVNLFVVRELLHAWKLESHKLRSPFFDYAAPAVAEALAKFQNLLSKNISISRENFQPLLKKAVSQTLFLIIDPYDFYSNTLDNGSGGMVKPEELKTDIKYVKINCTPLEKLISTLQEKNLEAVSGNEAFALLDRILEEVNFTPEDIDGYITQFSKVVPLNLESLYEKKQPVPPSIPKAPMPVPAPTLKVNTVRVPEKAEVQKKPANVPVGVAAAKSGAPTTLAENFQKAKKIKDALTINQKFMFTKILFNGDFELFSNAIDRLDDLDNLNQANSYLSNNFGEWNKDSEEYQEFMEMVEKRFG